ncbi:MAG: NADH:ubiquinone reductase (Na(+)-transporting) subunit C [Pirellulaceae bacterium]
MSSTEVEELFESRVTKKLLDLDTGEYVDDPPEGYDPRKAAKDDAQNEPIEGFDIGLANREKLTWVYLVQDSGGKIEKVVVPIYGMGLWSTLYGYVALENDLATVAGLTYYQHGETPGLGGEVENPAWKAKWIGKKIWDAGKGPAMATDEDLRIGVAKGAPVGENQKYQVDGLSGATITSRGVESMLKYWFSSEGFGPYLKNLASQQGATSGETNS